MAELGLSCRCGKVRGVIHDASPAGGNHLICYCASCQKFPNHLGAPEVLDEYGGTDIYQVPVGRVEFTAGRDLLSCLRLTEKGAYRWYAGCCRTPIGNTVSPALPFMGVIRACIDTNGSDEILGPVRLDANTRDALKPLPEERRRGSMPLFILRFLSQLLLWKLTGKSRPNPVFKPSGEPIAVPEILG